MLFNSIPFLIFFPTVFFLYWLLKSRRYQNLLLLAASYFFYGWWDWRFLSLILLSSLVDFVAGKKIFSARTTAARRFWLLVSLFVNLGALFVFKYLDFGIESFVRLVETFGYSPNIHTLKLILPVGISFYTFQTLSYTIDIYRRRIEPTNDAISFFTFVAFFPQLVAGPIERASNLLRQFTRERVFNDKRAADGCRQILYGLFLKIVVADNLGATVDYIYAQSHEMDGVILLIATVLFAFQIYGDFAGYSHIAIGCARVLGFDLMRNFAYPYFSRSPAEFWHRWHISLSTWFRDYVYIPLGGNRKGPWRRRLNVIITFLVSGLWHGAGLNFIVWGGFHGLLTAFQWWKPHAGDSKPCGGRLFPRIRDLAALGGTFTVVCLLWVFFRAETLAEGAEILWKIVRDVCCGNYDPFTLTLLPFFRIPLILLFVIAVEWFQKNKLHPLAVDRLPLLLRWATYATFAFGIVFAGRVGEMPFIYFEF